MSRWQLRHPGELPKPYVRKVHLPFTVEEEEVMLNIYREQGGAWSAIAKALESR